MLMYVIDYKEEKKINWCKFSSIITTTGPYCCCENLLNAKTGISAHLAIHGNLLKMWLFLL